MQSDGSTITLEPGEPVILVAPGALSGMPYRADVPAWLVFASGERGALYIDCLDISPFDRLQVRVVELEEAVAALQRASSLQAPPQGTSPPSSSGTIHLQCSPGYAGIGGIGDVELVTGIDFISIDGSSNPQRIEVVTGASLTTIDATCTID